MAESLEIRALSHRAGVEMGILRPVKVLAARLGISRVWRLVFRSGIPILAFHGVLPDQWSFPFNATGKFISPERLYEFVLGIKSIFRIVALNEIIDNLVAGRQMPPNVMAITFDDGYANLYEYALPVLRRLDVPVTVFVTTGLIDSDSLLWNDLLEYAVHTTRRESIDCEWIGRSFQLRTPGEKQAAILQMKDRLKEMPPDRLEGSVRNLIERLDVRLREEAAHNIRFLTSQQIKEMAAQGIAFGSHTVTHRILSKLGGKEIETEVVRSKDHLEAILNKEVTLFAYPNGRKQDFDDRVKAALRSAGYVAAFTTIRGMLKTGDDLLEITRITIDGRWSYSEFEAEATGVLRSF